MSANQGIESVGKIISDTKDQLRYFKQALQTMPGIGKGQMPPQFARLQNKIQQTMQVLQNKQDIILNSVIKSGGSTTQDIPDLKFPTLIKSKQRASSRMGATNTDLQPIKQTLKAMRTSQLTSDPLSAIGNQIVKEKFSLPIAAQKGNLRSVGKNDFINKRISAKTTQPKKIFSKKYRDDPFAQPPPITQNDIQSGLHSLVLKGVIPRDVDLTPAFERGAPPFCFKPAKLHDRSQAMQRQQIQTGDQFHNSAAIKYNIAGKSSSNQNFINQPIGGGGSSQALVPYQQQSQGGFGSRQKVAFPISNVDLSDQFGLPALPNQNTASQRGISNQQMMIMHQSSGAAVIDQQQQQQQYGGKNARSYQELMDTYASHNIIIRKCKVVQTTPQFLSFKRTYIQRWGSISLILHMLQKMLAQYNVQFTYVDGKKVAQLADQQIKKPSKQKLFDCLLNQEQLADQIRLPQRMFRGPKGNQNAAIMIQKTFRMHQQYNKFQKLKYLRANAAIIQRQFRLYEFVRFTKAKIEEKNNEALYIWRQTQEQFKKKWADVIKKKQRIEIHINSISVAEMKRMTMEKFLQRQNAQITRIFSMKDPNVDVIYVSPFQLTNDVIGYYMKIIQIGEIDNPTSRLNFIVPENYVKFPTHFSLATCLLLSPKALKRIKTLIKGKQAYIVPGMVSTQDIKVSIALGVPILCGEAQKVQSMTTKSGAKRIFQQADVPTSLAAYDIYSQQQFYSSLAKLIAGNPYVNTWIFKIDDQYNSRGHAIFNTESVKLPSELRRKKGTAEAARMEKAATLKSGGGDAGASVSITEDILEQLQNRLMKQVPKHAKLSVPLLYDSDWKQYIRAFVQVGGVIEASPNCSQQSIGSPSISFLIEPSGEIDVMGSYDKFAAKDMVNVGGHFPQISLPYMNLKTLSKSIGDVLYQKGIIGHVTVDLVSFPDPTDPDAHPLFWAVDLNLNLTDYVACQLFFNFMMGGKMDKVTGQYTVEVAQDQDEFEFAQMNENKADDDQALFEPRTFMFCKFLNHPLLSSIQYKMFFHLCRLDSISFDLQKRIGSTFVLPDCLQSGTIALLSIAEQRKVTTNYMNDALSFIQNISGKAPRRNFTSGQARSDDVNPNLIFSKVKLMQRQEERKAGRQKNEPKQKYHDQMMRK